MMLWRSLDVGTLTRMLQSWAPRPVPESASAEVAKPVAPANPTITPPKRLAE